MDRFKKGLYFSKDVGSRDRRAHARDLERRNSRHVRLSNIRNIEDTSFNSDGFEASPKIVEKKELKPKTPSRVDILMKWKMEKELKKKVESQKIARPFIISSSASAPSGVFKIPAKPALIKSRETTGKHVSSIKPPVFQPKVVPKQVTSAKSAPSMKPKLNVSVSSSFGFQKFGSQSKIAPVQKQVTRSAPTVAKNIVQSRPAFGNRKPTSASAAIGKPQLPSVSRPQVGIPKFQSRTVKKEVEAEISVPNKINNQIVSRLKPKPALLRAPENRIRDKSPAVKIVKKPGTTHSKPGTTDSKRGTDSKLGTTDSKPRSTESKPGEGRPSFAPLDFKFKPIFTNILFPNGIFSSSKPSLAKKPFRFSFDTTPSVASSESQKQVLVEDPNIMVTDTEQIPDNSQPTIEKAVPVRTFGNSPLLPVRSIEKTEDKEKVDLKEFEESVGNEFKVTNPGRSSARISLFHTVDSRLASITEESCDNPQNKSFPAQLCPTPKRENTPRRSRRLAFKSELVNTPTNNNCVDVQSDIQDNVPQMDVINQLETLSVTCPSDKNVDVPDDQENFCSGKNVTTRKRSQLLKESTSPLKSVNGFENMSVKVINSPKPFTRQQRKISLLGSPHKPQGARVSSIKGDLIVFSPSD